MIHIYIYILHHTISFVIQIPATVTPDTANIARFLLQTEARPVDVEGVARCGKGCAYQIYQPWPCQVCFKSFKIQEGFSQQELGNT